MQTTPSASAIRKKAGIALLLISCLYMAAAAQTHPLQGAPNEMLVNGSFAKGMLESNDPWKWIVNAHPNVAMSLENGALRMRRLKKDGFSNVRQDAPRELEFRYRLSFKAKVEGRGTLVYGGHGLLAENQNFTQRSESRELGPCDWTQVSMDFEIPESESGYFVDRVGVFFHLKDERTTAHISSVSLTPVAEPSILTKEIFLADDDQKVLCGGIQLSPGASCYEVRAARILRSFLYNLYGAIVPVVWEPQAANPGKGRIFIGEAALNAGILKGADIGQLGEGGYLVLEKGGSLGIAGKDGSGTISGVYAFLEKHGVKFLAAGEEEWLAPISPLIKDLRLSRSPAFEFRLGGDCSLGYMDKRILGSPRDAGVRFSYWAHTADLMVNYNFYHKDHPEYFALTKKGERQKYPEGHTDFSCLHLCMSNPEVQRIALQSMLRWIELQPERKYFMVSQGDYEPWCECEKCRAMDPDSESRTDRLLTFVNGIAKEVAKMHPDKRILTLAYTKALQAPIHVKPESNVIVMFCPCGDEGGACQSHAFCECNSGLWRKLNDWLKLCPGQMYVFDYPGGAKCPMDVFGSFYAMADKIRFYSKNGIMGISFCGSPAAFTALFNNVMSQLLWDPNLDLEGAIDEFMERYYGNAAPMMREWFDLIHREVRERPVHHLKATASGLVTGNLARRGYFILDEAAKSAGGNPKLLKRINDEKIHLLFSDLNERNPMNGLVIVDDVFTSKLAELLRLAAERRITTFDRKDWKSRGAAEWLREIANLRLEGEAGSSWWKDRRIEEFLKNPKSLPENPM
jgi:hypothetical protein